MQRNAPRASRTTAPTITTEAGSLRTTVYHPFWVTDGADLHERSIPRELAEDEDQGLSLDGRWVNSHDLRVGDTLISHDGQPRTVLAIEQQYKTGFPVNNLTIEENHTFAVGPGAILVHNTSNCDDAAEGLAKGAQQKLSKSRAKQLEDLMNKDGTDIHDFKGKGGGKRDFFF